MIRNQVLNSLKVVMPKIEWISNAEDKVERMRQMQFCKAFRKPKMRLIKQPNGKWELVSEKELVEDKIASDRYELERELNDEQYQRQDLNFRRDHDGN